MTFFRTTTDIWEQTCPFSFTTWKGNKINRLQPTLFPPNHILMLSVLAWFCVSVCIYISIHPSIYIYAENGGKDCPQTANLQRNPGFALISNKLPWELENKIKLTQIWKLANVLQKQRSESWHKMGVPTDWKEDSIFQNALSTFYFNWPIHFWEIKHFPCFQGQPVDCPPSVLLPKAVIISSREHLSEIRDLGTAPKKDCHLVLSHFLHLRK